MMGKSMKLTFRNRGLQCFDFSMLAGELEAVDRQEGHKPDNLYVQCLDLSNNRLQLLLNGRSFAHSLHELDLSYNALRCIPLLPPTLAKLDLSHNELESLDGLHELKLVILEASHNRITAISSDLPSTLEVLILKSNNLRSITRVGGLFRLLRLDVSDNEISAKKDLAALSALSALRHLFISGNSVENEADFVSFLLQTLGKLTSLNGMSLSQAQANRSYKKIVETNKSSRSEKGVDKVYQHDPRSRTPSALEAENESLTNAVRELERLSKELFTTEKNERFHLGTLRQQLKRSINVREEQERQSAALAAEIARLQEDAASLQRTLGSLEKSYESQHVALITRRLH